MDNFSLSQGKSPAEIAFKIILLVFSGINSRAEISLCSIEFLIAVALCICPGTKSSSENELNLVGDGFPVPKASPSGEVSPQVTEGFHYRQTQSERELPPIPPREVRPFSGNLANIVEISQKV